MSEEQGGLEGADYAGLYRSYIEALNQVDHLSTLREIGLAINASLDLDETLTTIANVVHGALDVYRLTLFEIDEGGRTAHPAVAKYGDDVISRERLEGETILVSGTPFGKALAQRRVILVNTELQNAAYVPLLARDTALGVMRLEDRGDGTPFTEHDVPLYLSVGSQIAVAINNARLYAMAVTDGLTGLYVRRYFDLRMREEYNQAKRYHRQFSVMLLDIDHFKVFNDTHGHQTGDAVLRQVAELIGGTMRSVDIVCRYGGEEMAVIMPETELNEAGVAAQKLCDRIRQHPFAGSGGKSLSVTCSIGVAAFRENDPGPDAIVQAADKALYAAKEHGRDRVELHGIQRFRPASSASTE